MSIKLQNFYLLEQISYLDQLFNINGYQFVANNNSTPIDQINYFLPTVLEPSS